VKKVIAVGLASALAAAAVAVPASAQTATKFRVLAITVSAHRVSSDTFAFRDRLVKPRNHSNVLGHDEVQCTQLSRTTLHCRAVFFFSNGKVKAKGNLDTTERRNKVPVIGGTSAYNGVAGKAIVTFRPHDRSLIEFTLVK
jgi:hypothetical protein